MLKLNHLVTFHSPFSHSLFSTVTAGCKLALLLTLTFMPLVEIAWAPSRIKIHGSFARPRPSQEYQRRNACNQLFRRPALGSINFEEFEPAIRTAERFDPLASRADVYFSGSQHGPPFGEVAQEMIRRHVEHVYETWRTQFKVAYEQDVESLGVRAESIQRIETPVSEPDVDFINETHSSAIRITARLQEVRLWLQHNLWENENVQLVVYAYISRLEEYQLNCRNERRPCAPTVILRLHELQRSREELISADMWLQRQIEGVNQDLKQMGSFIQTIEDMNRGRSGRTLFRR